PATTRPPPGRITPKRSLLDTYSSWDVFQVIKTWKQSTDPCFEAKKNRVLHVCGLMEGDDDVEEGDPDVVICVDEFGPLNLQPHPGRHWAARGGGGAVPRRRRRATYTRPHGVRPLLAPYHLSRDRLYGHIKPRKRRGEFLVFCRYLRTLYPPGVRLGIEITTALAEQGRAIRPATIQAALGELAATGLVADAGEHRQQRGRALPTARDPLLEAVDLH